MRGGRGCRGGDVGCLGAGDCCCGWGGDGVCGCVCGLRGGKGGEELEGEKEEGYRSRSVSEHGWGGEVRGRVGTTVAALCSCAKLIRAAAAAAATASWAVLQPGYCFILLLCDKKLFTAV